MIENNITPSFTSVDDIICQYLDNKNKQTTANRGQDYWFASQLGKCKRFQFLQRKGVLSQGGQTRYTWKNNARDGHAMHEWRQDALKQMNVLHSAEGELVNEKYHYRGHYDVIVILDGDKHVLADFKTQSNRIFKARKGIINLHHKKQLGSYFLFGKKADPLLTEARLYYINRETGEREEFIVTFTPEDLQGIKDELNLLNKYWKNNKVPPAEKSYVFCKNFCPFTQLCEFYGSTGNRTFTKAPGQDPILPSLSISSQ
jgi:CRISPR/Cas system-associated exonuclease Cas4 (RecB family)